MARRPSSAPATRARRRTGSSGPTAPSATPAACAWTSTARRKPARPRSASSPAPAALTSSGDCPAALWSTPRPAPASMTPATTPRPAPAWKSTTATAAPASNGESPQPGHNRPGDRGSAAPVGGIGERAEQQRDMVMLLRVADLEDHRDLRVERLAAQVLTGLEGQLVHPGAKGAGQVADPPAGVGDGAGHGGPAGPVAGPTGQGDAQPGRRAAGDG